MPRNIIVSRHPASIEWLRQQLNPVDLELAHLDTELLQPGDCVYGNLTVHLVVEVNERRARYFHLQINLPPELRGVELDAQQLASLNPVLTEIRAESVPA
jgi:CRISPR-associated protein Csx16